MQMDIVRRATVNIYFASEVIDFAEATDESETAAGQTGPKLLIKSEPPEGKTRKRKPGKHRGNRIGNGLIESETPKGSARRKAREGEYEGSVRSLR
ncbi:hypothetical protein, partial [Streptomyces sp. NPDC046985]|uniref:hypothetical protein n=1 Tax=Streptomyces sp. NPDC046985 TaxID=3155377 RepID=UPI0033F11E5D